MLKASQLTGFGGRGPFQFNYTDAATSGSDLSAYTFASRALGVEHPRRVVMVGVLGTKVSPTSTISSLTINGVSATYRGGGTIAANTHRMEFWSAPVPLGSTGDIVVTWGATMARCGIMVANMINATSEAPYDIQFHNVGDPSTVNLNVPANGGVMAISANSNTATCTWSLANEAIDTAIEAARNFSAAWETYATEQAALAVSADWSAGSSEQCLLAASWR